MELDLLKVFRPQIGVEDAIERDNVPDRLSVSISANLRLAGTGNIPPGHMKLNFCIPAQSDETPLLHLERSACETAADVLEAIVSELRRRAAD